MCIVFICHAAHPRFRLVLAANRDEFVGRAARPCAPWDPNGPYAGLLAGRDEEGGGTWLGVQPETARWATLTNVREPPSIKPPAGAPSRGTLPLKFLACTAATPERALEPPLRALSARAGDWDGFNLLVGDARDVWYATNRAEADSFDADTTGAPAPPDAPLGRGLAVRRLPAGMHVMSNAQLNTPWPKAVRGRAILSQLLDAHKSPPPRVTSAGQRAAAREALAQEILRSLLSDTDQPEDARLPTTGVSRRFERSLSSVCVGPTSARMDSEELPLSAEPDTASSGRYATVSQAVLLVEHDGHATLVERQVCGAEVLPVRTMASDGADDRLALRDGCRVYTLQLPSA